MDEPSDDEVLGDLEHRLRSTPRLWDSAASLDDLRSYAEQGVAALLALVGEDPNREGLADTPARVVRAFLEMCCRPGDPAQLLTRVFTDTDAPTDEMVSVGPIPFASLCEHHLLPFTGQAWVAYVPSGDRVVGLSKLARLVEHFACRPQVQERMTTQIADSLDEHLKPRGAGVILAATHTCMSLRGIRKVGAVMKTSKLVGDFKTDAAMRAEFLSLAQA